MDETKTGRVQGDSGSTLRRIPRRRPPRGRWRQAFGPSRRTDIAVLCRVVPPAVPKVASVATPVLPSAPQCSPVVLMALPPTCYEVRNVNLFTTHMYPEPRHMQRFGGV